MLSVIPANSGNTTILRCIGRLVAGEEAWSLYNTVISLPSKRALVLDLTGVDRVDARGIGVLLFVKQWATGNGAEFEVIASKPVQRLLELTELDSHFEIRTFAGGTASSADVQYGGE